jgi:hypothetical protein
MVERRSKWTYYFLVGAAFDQLAAVLWASDRNYVELSQERLLAAAYEMIEQPDGRGLSGCRFQPPWPIPQWPAGLSLAEGGWSAFYDDAPGRPACDRRPGCLFGTRSGSERRSGFYVKERLTNI